MDMICVRSGVKLNGEVAASGAKNAALPILFSSLLAEGTHRFTNVPKLKDIESTCELLNYMGCETEFENNELKVIVPKLKEFLAPYDLVRKMRASILCLGPLLAKYGKAKVSLPGGCAIGSRPINLHLDGFKALGAELDVDSGYVSGQCEKLIGAVYLLDNASVGATENIMMAATLADGETVIENAAKEPEIVDLGDYLIKMGAKIEGLGTSVIRVTGVEELRPAEHSIIPDRIEAGTLLVAGAITGGEVTVTNCCPSHLTDFTTKMRESGFELTSSEDSITVHPCSEWRGVDVSTAPFPGFATDLQAQFMVLMTQASGVSVISETVFENRFMHVQELVRLSADITPRTRVAIVRGCPGGLTGAPVMATDLRASACLILAGLVAKGETEVRRIYHLDRGYERLEDKLSQLGAQIVRKKQQ